MTILFDVIVGTGEETKTFQVSKDQLSYHSKYCRDAHARAKNKGIGTRVYLPSWDPEHFEAFLAWLNRVPSEQIFPNGITLIQGVTLWAMGNELAAPSFKNYIVEELHAALMCGTEGDMITEREAEFCWVKTEGVGQPYKLMEDMLVQDVIYGTALGHDDQWQKALERQPEFQNKLFLAVAQTCLSETGLRCYKPVSAYLEPEEMNGDHTGEDENAG